MTETLAELPLIARGKVREMYALESVDGASALLMVASDRISTYDAVHPTPIPDKGKVLTGLSVFWFEKTDGIVANQRDGALEVDRLVVADVGLGARREDRLGQAL